MLLVLALAVFAGVTAHAGGDRIVGGNPTTIEYYPSIVQVDSFNVWTEVWSQSCAANILNSRFLLSAAHCFRGMFYEARTRRVRAGTTHRNYGGLIRQVERAFNHPSFGKLGNDGDISVVKLEYPLYYNPVIQQATIISSGIEIPDNVPVVHAGWGHTTQNGVPSPVLRDVLIYTINNDLCRERYLTLPRPGIVTRNMICAGLLDIGGRDACQGDSGGPLYYGNIVIGIVAWGHGCANATFPGISTAVSPYTDWVIDIVNNN